jgi:hypothetical protein
VNLLVVHDASSSARVSSRTLRLAAFVAEAEATDG